MTPANCNLDDLAGRLDAIAAIPGSATTVTAAATMADELLAIGEATLETWLKAQGATPTSHTVEGFRLLGLQRQAAREDPSFNACRETCRELVYHRNLAYAESSHANAARWLRLGAMVARHLVLFIGGKLEVARLGEFCCSSRPLREREAAGEPAPIACHERETF